MQAGDWTRPDFRGQVAVVTGASRGVGRGIAEALGQCGATVYVTGRSGEGRAPTEGLPGNIEETAAAVDRAGGHGIAVTCDHTSDGHVEQLFSRVAAESGRLDLLVNNVWGGYERYEEAGFDKEFWSQPMWRWDAMFAAGVRAHFTASRLAAPIMIKKRHGLVVCTSSGDGTKYRGNLAYDVAKTAVERMAWGMARELRPHGVAAVAVLPGFCRTERVLAFFKGNADHPELAATHTPQYVGRAVAKLAANPQVLKWSGQALMVGDMAAMFDFTDTDGRRVPAFHLPDPYA